MLLGNRWLSTAMLLCETGAEADCTLPGSRRLTRVPPAVCTGAEADCLVRHSSAKILLLYALAQMQAA